MRLPLELQEKIVVSSNDPSALLRFALVHSAWVPASRALYFHLTPPISVNLTGIPRGARHRPRFTAMPTAALHKAHAAELIELLKSPQATFPHHIHSIQSFYEAAQPPNDYLAKLASSDIQLTELRLSEDGSALWGMGRLSLKAEIVMPPRLGASVQSLTLNSATLALSNAFSLLSQCSALTTLSFQMWADPEYTSRNDHLELSSCPPPPSSLKVLRLKAPDYVVERFLQWMDTESSRVALRSLSVESKRYEDFKSLAFMSHVTSRSGSELEELRLDCMVCDLGGLQLEHLSSLHCLRLHLGVQLNPEPDFMTQYVDQVIDILETVPARNMHTLDVKLPFSPTESQRSRLEDVMRRYLSVGCEEAGPISGADWAS